MGQQWLAISLQNRGPDETHSRPHTAGTFQLRAFMAERVADPSVLG